MSNVVPIDRDGSETPNELIERARELELDLIGGLLNRPHLYPDTLAALAGERLAARLPALLMDTIGALAEMPEATDPDSLDLMLVAHCSVGTTTEAEVAHLLAELRRERDFQLPQVFARDYRRTRLQQRAYDCAVALTKRPTDGDLLARLTETRNELEAIATGARDPATGLPEGSYLAANAEPSLDDRGVVRGLIGFETTSAVYGPPNLGKSFFCLELAACVATGAPFFGRQTTQGLVVYIAAEGQGSFARRVRARHLAHGIPTDTPLLIYPNVVFLREPERVDAFIEEIRHASIHLGQKPMLVIIDTLNRSMGGGNENTEEMAAAVAGADHIGTELDCAVLIVHHPGKDASKGMRGHSSLIGAIDTEIQLSSIDVESRRIHFTTTKQRDMAIVSGDFQLIQQEIGDAPDGRPVTSCFVRELEQDEAAVPTPGARADAEDLPADWADAFPDGEIVTPYAFAKWIQMRDQRTQISGPNDISIVSGLGPPHSKISGPTARITGANKRKAKRWIAHLLQDGQVSEIAKEKYVRVVFEQGAW